MRRLARRLTAAPMPPPCGRRGLCPVLMCSTKVVPTEVVTSVPECSLRRARLVMGLNVCSSVVVVVVVVVYLGGAIPPLRIIVVVL